MLDADDTTKVPGSAPLADGMVVDVDRVSKDHVTETITVPPPVQETKTDSLSVGQDKVVDAGTAGTVVETYRVTTIDGEAGRQAEVGQHPDRRAEGKVVQVGTKPKPAPSSPAPSDPGSPAVPHRQRAGTASPSASPAATWAVNPQRLLRRL